MKTSLLLASLLAAIGLAACDRPTVVNNPPSSSTTVAVPTPVPGPPGPQGEPGKPGEPGTSSSTNVTITPPAAASEPK
jgi:hypothetical protein